MEIKHWVKAARLHAGLSGEALGERIGRTKANISHWETGQHEPSVSQVIRISEVTGYPVGHLFNAAASNVDGVAQNLSHASRQDGATVSNGGDGQQTISLDREFRKMSPTERRRFVRLWSAAFDDPPEVEVTVEGDLWMKPHRDGSRRREFGAVSRQTSTPAKRAKG